MDTRKLGKGLVLTFLGGALCGLYNVTHDVSHFIWLFAPEYFNRFGAGARWAHLPFLFGGCLAVCICGAFVAGFYLVSRLDETDLYHIANVTWYVILAILLVEVFVIVAAAGAVWMIVYQLRWLFQYL